VTLPVWAADGTETRHGKVVGVSEQTVQVWIDSAKGHE
jgi:hypothetical protein